MYCIEEIYQHFLPGDLGPLFTTQLDYSSQFETLEAAEKFCDYYNHKYENTLNEWPKLQPYLMTEQDMKAWIAEQDYEREMWDNYGI